MNRVCEPLSKIKDVVLHCWVRIKLNPSKKLLSGSFRLLFNQLVRLRRVKDISFSLFFVIFFYMLYT